MLKQISMFLENKAGRLARVCRVMAEEGINIRALSIADTADFGLVRLIVDNPELAEQKLSARGFMVSITEVVGVKVPDRPGGLGVALDVLDSAEVSVEYIYAFIGKSDDRAMVILRLDNNDKGVEALRKANLELLTPEEVYTI